jgi:hypothetical protein
MLQIDTLSVTTNAWFWLVDGVAGLLYKCRYLRRIDRTTNVPFNLKIDCYSLATRMLLPVRQLWARRYFQSTEQALFQRFYRILSSIFIRSFIRLIRHSIHTTLDSYDTRFIRHSIHTTLDSYDTRFIRHSIHTTLDSYDTRYIRYSIYKMSTSTATVKVLIILESLKD